MLGTDCAWVSLESDERRATPCLTTAGGKWSFNFLDKSICLASFPLRENVWCSSANKCGFPFTRNRATAGLLITACCPRRTKPPSHMVLNQTTHCFGLSPFCFALSGHIVMTEQTASPRVQRRLFPGKPNLVTQVARCASIGTTMIAEAEHLCLSGCPFWLPE